jgi:hypothetical protein
MFERVTFILAREVAVESSAIARHSLLSALGTAKVGKATLLCIDFTAGAVAQTRQVISAIGPPCPEVRFVRLREANQAIVEAGETVLLSHDFPRTTQVVKRICKGTGPSQLFLFAVAPSLIDSFKVVPPGRDCTPGSDTELRPAFESCRIMKLAASLISPAYRRRVRMACGVIALSEIEQRFLSRFHKVRNTFVVCPAIDPRFRFQSGRGEDAVAFVHKRVGGATVRQIEKLTMAAGCKRLKLIGHEGAAVRSLWHRIPPIVLGFIPFERLVKEVSEARLAFVTDPHGAFEMAPLEILRAGTPVVSPWVPSLVELLRRSPRSDFPDLPFWPLWTNSLRVDLDVARFSSWFAENQRNARAMSDVVSREFSLAQTGRGILEGLERALSAR